MFTLNEMEPLQGFQQTVTSSILYGKKIILARRLAGE